MESRPTRAIDTGASLGVCPVTVTVSGNLTPAEAAGDYVYSAYFNDKPYWVKGPMRPGAWFIYWSATLGIWRLYAGTIEEYWYKGCDLHTPLGDYVPMRSEAGIATVSTREL